MLTKQEIRTGNYIASVLGANVGGSYVVHGEAANDFDIFIGASAFGLLKKDQYRFTVRTFNDEGQTVVFVDSWDDRSEYYQSNNTDDALVCTFRSTCGKYNLIVVNDDFVLAFKISANIMAAHPESYQEKDERVRLHHCWREHIRNWLSDSFAIGKAIVTY